MRFLALVLLLSAAFISLSSVPIAAQQPPPLTTTTISGGDLPHPIQLAAADHEAFMRRLDLPPLLDDEPELRGKSYTITSPYWDAGVRAGDNTQFVVEEVAIYYPEGGFVETDQNGETVWTALDTTQKAIVDRYIRYANELPEKPSIFEVLRVAGLANEPIGISIGDVEMTPDQRTKFWQAAKDLPIRDLPPAPNQEPLDFSETSSSSAWLLFALPSGRTIQMHYSNVSGTLIEPTEAIVRPGQGQPGKMVPVPRDWLVPVLGSLASPGSGELAPLAIPQDDSQGSPIWWLVMFGGGVGAIVAAILLHRQLAKAPLKGHDAGRLLEP